MKKGFTLLELLIVIAIVAIIAAVVIPSLIKSKIAGNEGAAAAELKTFNGMLVSFKKSNYQGRGKKYPLGYGPETNSGKYCCLYCCLNGAHERLTMIGFADAKADMRADGDTDAREDVGFYYPEGWTAGGVEYLTPPITFRLQPKAGYWFGLMMYAQSGNTKIPYNDTYSANHYAIVGFPADYGSSGQTTFVVDEGGTVFFMDFGEGKYRDTFPGPDPVKNGWEVAQ